MTIEKAQLLDRINKNLYEVESFIDFHKNIFKLYTGKDVKN